MEVSASRGWGASWAEEDRLGVEKEAWSEMTVAHSSGLGLVTGSRSRGTGL